MLAKGINRREFISKTSLTLAGIAAMKTRAFSLALENTGLKDLYRNDFLIGAAVSASSLIRNDTQLLEIIKREFSSITAENIFKWGPIHPEDDKWNFDVPDLFVRFGEANNMHILGHVLVWHSQVPGGLFTNEKGEEISKDALMRKMEDHILTLVDRYKGRIHAWDVVNEAITPEDKWRPTSWYKILGPEFMERAFHLAWDADPNAHLIYNDYNMDDPKRRQYVVEIIQDLKRKNVPINGIGMQGHVGLDNPDLLQFEESIKAFIGLGLKVHITELDVDVLPYDWSRTAEISTNVEYAKTLNPYTEGLPKKVEKQLAKRYEELFKLFLKYKDDIERVTFWGVSDDMSWKNDFPMNGRTNYPLLFDRDRNPKKCYEAIAKLRS